MDLTLFSRKQKVYINLSGMSSNARGTKHSGSKFVKRWLNNLLSLSLWILRLSSLYNLPRAVNLFLLIIFAAYSILSSLPMHFLTILNAPLDWLLKKDDNVLFSNTYFPKSSFRSYNSEKIFFLAGLDDIVKERQLNAKTFVANFTKPLP